MNQPPPVRGYGHDQDEKPAEPGPVPSTERVHQPRRWLAIVLSLVMAGVGHAYLGVWQRGAKLVAILAAIGLVGAALMPHAGALWGLVLIAMSPAVLVRFFAAFDVANLAASDVRARPAVRTALQVVVAWVVFSGFAMLFSVVTRVFFLESFKIPAGSMRPTVEIGDHLFAGKLSKDVGRGDLLIFEFPENREQDFIKRVVALEGDLVEIDENGWLLVNGFRAPTCEVGELPATPGSAHSPSLQTVYVEFLDGRPHLIARERSPRGSAHFGPFKVAPGEVFVLGDNRDNSHDSRGWNGGRGRGVPLDHRKGKPFSNWLSLRADGQVAWNRIGLLGPPRLPDAPELAPALARCLAAPPPSMVPSAVH